MQIVRPRLEALREPMGVDEPRPRFSWQLRSQERSAAQSAYRIEVHAGDTLVWDSGKVVSRQNSQVEYAGRRSSRARTIGGGFACGMSAAWMRALAASRILKRG